MPRCHVGAFVTTRRLADVCLLDVITRRVATHAQDIMAGRDLGVTHDPAACQRGRCDPTTLNDLFFRQQTRRDGGAVGWPEMMQLPGFERLRAIVCVPASNVIMIRRVDDPMRVVTARCAPCVRVRTLAGVASRPSASSSDSSALSRHRSCQTSSRYGPTRVTPYEPPDCAGVTGSAPLRAVLVQRTFQRGRRHWLGGRRRHRKKGVTAGQKLQE